jgi:hypothetical protein
VAKQSYRSRPLHTTGQHQCSETVHVMTAKRPHGLGATSTSCRITLLLAQVLTEHASDSDVRSRSAELSLHWHVCDAWEPLWHAKHEELSGWAVPISIKVLLACALVYFEQRECIASCSIGLHSKRFEDHARPSVLRRGDLSTICISGIAMLLNRRCARNPSPNRFSVWNSRSRSDIPNCLSIHLSCLSLCLA